MAAIFPPSAEDEVRRVRHSGLLNPNVATVSTYLSAMALPERDITNLIRLLPEPFVDVFARYLMRDDEELVDMQQAAVASRARYDKAQRTTESLKEALVKVANEREFQVQKYDSLHQGVRQQLQHECDEVSERKKKQLLLQRQTEKLEHQEKRLQMELQRLQHLK